jgi:hypothetical protein
MSLVGVTKAVAVRAGTARRLFRGATTAGNARPTILTKGIAHRVRSYNQVVARLIDGVLGGCIVR